MELVVYLVVVNGLWQCACCVYYSYWPLLRRVLIQFYFFLFCSRVCEIIIDQPILSLWLAVYMYACSSSTDCVLGFVLILIVSFRILSSWLSSPQRFSFGSIWGPGLTWSILRKVGRLNKKHVICYRKLAWRLFWFSLRRTVLWLT